MTKTYARSCLLPLTAMLVLGLGGCGTRIQQAPNPGDNILLPPIEWRIREHVALEQEFRSTGAFLDPQHSLQGFALYTEQGVAVIYTLPPRRVDDAVTCTLGHEIMHIALNGFHE